MIKELTSQLARVDNLTVEGKTSTLHLITQETADEERRGVERQNEALKQALRERDQEIQKRDMTIQEHTSESKYFDSYLFIISYYSIQSIIYNEN